LAAVLVALTVWLLVRSDVAHGESFRREEWLEVEVFDVDILPCSYESWVAEAQHGAPGVIGRKFTVATIDL
jgi:hypothetical protein